MKAIILSGGSGTRLWPLSRSLMPKQFLNIFEGKSLFQHTILRNKEFFNNFIIVTNENHYFIALDQIEEIERNGLPDFNFILEPFGKNTAAAIAFGCFAADKDEIIFVTPSDHLIKSLNNYEKAIKRGKELAEKDYLVTFGINPEYPETGYGYIEAEDENVIRFHEKPDKKQAEIYLKKGNFYWNSGMFMFKAKTYLEELKKHAPEIYETSKEAFIKAQKNNNLIRIKPNHMEKIIENSIDYAVMEKSKKVKVVKGNFHWNDVGSFDNLADEMDSKNAVEIDSQNNFYYSNSDKKIIATIGLENYIVIDTKDALLVVKKGQTQKVKDIVNQLKNTHCSLLTTHSTVHRPWGSYEVLTQGTNYKIKRIIVKPGKRLSLQKHFHRNEHWIVVSGTAEVQVGDKNYLVRANESTYIKMGEIHRLSNPGKIPIVLIEVQVGEYLEENDIIRLKDDFERENR